MHECVFLVRAAEPSQCQTTAGLRRQIAQSRTENEGAHDEGGIDDGHVSAAQEPSEFLPDCFSEFRSGQG